MAQATEIPTRPGQTAATPYNTPATPAPTQMSRPQVPDAVAEGEEEAAAAGPNAGLTREQLLQNPAFASMVEGRLAGLLGRSSGYIESLPAAVRHRVDGLQGLQVEQSKIEAEFQAEILELEKKYAKRYAPLYNQRSAIINGQQEPSDEQVESGRQADDDNEDSDDEAPQQSERPKATAADLAQGPKGIPEFWLTALKNHIGISDTITERDEELLKHLKDLRIEYLEDKKGFKLVFDFDEGAQEYFSNKSLEKTYIYQDEVGYEGDLIYDHAEGSTIEWKEGKDLTTRVETKKQRNKNTGQTRIIKKVVPSDSFFSFFSPPSLDDESDEEEDEDIETKLELDYQIGEDLKERVIPRAVDFFTGKALRYANDMDDMGSDDEFDEDEDDDDDEEDDDDSSAARRLGPPPSGATPSSAQDPQECKQS